MAASAAFLCYCERRYRGVKVGEGGERRKGKSAEEDECEWEEGRKEKMEQENEEDEGEEGKKNGPRQAATFTLGVLTASKPQRSGSRKPTAAANPSPRLVRGKMGRKGWLSTLLGLSPGQGGFLCSDFSSTPYM